MTRSQLIAALNVWAPAILPPQPPKQLGLQACAATLSYLFLNFLNIILFLLIEMGSHYVAQAGLKLLG